MNRFALIAGIIVAGIAVAWIFYRTAFTWWVKPWYLHWGATMVERDLPMPGDEIVPNPDLQSTRAITIRAPAPEVYAWVAQIGQGRGGLYSYDWLENLFGSDIHSVDRIVPELQQPQVGDTVWLARGVWGDKGPHNVVAAVQPGRYLVLAAPDGVAFTWAFDVRPLDASSARLVVRVRSANFVPISLIQFIMERGMLLGLKARAERWHQQLAPAPAAALN